MACQGICNAGGGGGVKNSLMISVKTSFVCFSNSRGGGGARRFYPEERSYGFNILGGNGCRSSELMDHDSYLYCGTNSDLFPKYTSVLNSLHIRLANDSIPIVQIVSLTLFCLNNPRLTNLKIGAAQQTEDNCHYFNVLGENAKQIKKLSIVSCT